jgi:hypothetical protein
VRCEPRIVRTVGTHACAAGSEWRRAGVRLGGDRAVLDLAAFDWAAFDWAAFDWADLFWMGLT